MVGVVYLLFPIKYSDYIKKYSEKYNIEEKTIYSVINIESGFKKNSISKVGAIGLMQIMPNTAEEVVKKLKWDIENVDLFDAETNIEIGCFYLRYLLDLYNENVINALCAYNWGLSNVNNWISNGNIDKNGVITNIPIKETRDYVSKYKINVFVYSTFCRIN